MLLPTTPIGKETLSKQVLEADKSACFRSGPCGAGKKALYLGTSLISRCFYIPWTEVTRVFKRVAMSQGGFSGRGIFGSLPYLVVVFGNGQEKQCRFKKEADVDRLLDEISKNHPSIPTHSAKAEKKLAEAAAAEEARYKKELSPEAENAVKTLRGDIEYLEKRASLSDMLAAAAKQKRIIDHMSPAFRIGGALIGCLGIAAALWGLIGLFTHSPYTFYFLIGGAAAFFLTLSTNTFPSRWNSRKTAEKDWNDAVARMQGYLGGRSTAFSVPAQYAHPIVLKRMIRVLREGRAENTADALRLMKEDLKALNSSVKVTQQEYDEVVKIKPIFLVCDYKDE